jgi:TonB family protein
MRYLGITVLLLLVSPCRAQQDQAKPKGDYNPQRCAPKLISKSSARSLDLPFRKGKKYRHSPVVAFQILESGETANAILKRSSGVPEVDKYALKSVHESKFNPRPGCGVIESSMDITIDFR